ncbi:hypothetical protein, conserved [Leishmania tarentolae]|uniref:Glycerophosphocholine acyltransferase 1 n=1 Tax=Leishmania tarentolae TaxID=5689 RepID=A0A640KSL1_LEITA|nr:hypothetical protein, conserved [Leishmania tarentolae]
MDHKFSKFQYFIGCSITLLYAGLIAASYFDISACPYVYDRPASLAPLQLPDAKQVCGDAADNHRLLFALEGGFSCHMVDIIVWAYVVGMFIFMSWKYIVYRLQGLHYFFLDYCYFHNSVLMCFLLWRLVDVKWSEQPIISWSAHMPLSRWLHGYEDNASNLSISTAAHAMDNETWWRPILTGTPIRRESWARLIVPSATHNYRLDGVYLPISFEILTCGYVVSHLTEAEVISSFVFFFTLLAGTFGPILGAILMWRNALLFHSFDRMSSCYLHLAPGIVQSLLLHRLFTSARREIESLDAGRLYENVTGIAKQFNVSLDSLLPSVHTLMCNMSDVSAAAAADNATKVGSTHNGPARLISSVYSTLTAKQQQLRFTQYAATHQLEALCGYGTLCYDLRRAVSYGNLLRLHFIMFCLWQVFYHTFNEWRRHARKKRWKKRLAKLERQRREFVQPASSTETGAELPYSSTVISEVDGVIPAERMTSYKWMMTHPPGGRKGILARFVLLFGEGRLPTTVMFQVTQWLLHMFFFTCSYPFIHVCFHYTLSAWPLMVLVLAFALVCVYNAACVTHKWISKLQQTTSKRMETECQEAAHQVDGTGHRCHSNNKDAIALHAPMRGAVSVCLRVAVASPPPPHPFCGCKLIRFTIPFYCHVSSIYSMFLSALYRVC